VNCLRPSRCEAFSWRRPAALRLTKFSFLTLSDDYP
jgi:hypothetical protein